MSTTVAPATTEAPETTTTTTEPPLVTEGATVIVANASIVGGSAGRMTDEIALAGFTTGEPTNATVDVEDSIVHYVVGDDDAQAVAESLATALGGVEVSELPEDPPTETGDLAGQVLLLLGNNQADRTLDELSGAASVDTGDSVVIVANASGVSGSAGRMTATLDRAGFTVGEATNGTEQRAESIVYFTDAEGAEDDANTLATELGGVEVAALPDPAPVEGGELDGDVLLLLGTNQADQSLDQLNP
ncbi:MAG: LytR C-terminal domain-containing protein [Actinomycetota bacterium]